MIREILGGYFGAVRVWGFDCCVAVIAPWLLWYGKDIVVCAMLCSSILLKIGIKNSQGEDKETRSLTFRKCR